MTLPEWVDPASPDDPRPARGDEDPRPEVPPDPDPVLTEKPVLEWTREDWARWIESSASSPAPEPERAEESARSADDVTAAPQDPAEDPAADEGVDGGPAIEVDVEAGSVQWPPLPSTDDERAWDEESGFPIVDIRLPEDGATHAVTDGERPWDEPPGLAVEAAEPVVDRQANLADDNERPWDEPPGLTTEAGQEAGQEGKPVGKGEPLGGPPSLFGAAARMPPFEAAPFEATPIPAPDLAHSASAELSPPPLVWPLPADPAPIEPVATVPPRPVPPRPVRAAPAPPTIAPVRAEPAVLTVERSHRIRSALGLLMVAVTVGIIVAGLITISVFAIGVAVRRALG